jgi:TolB-like protein/Tfp pilus assembly protein PilF
LFNELKRRNVFKVGIAYIITAWVLLQIGDTLGPALLLPDWINSALAFFLLLGFPLALFFAWAFEMTPEGVKKQKDIDRSESITSQTGRKLDYTIIGLLAVALIYFVWESRFENEPPSEAVAQTKSVTEAETVVAAITNEPEQAVTKQSIAVLPFDNRSALEEDEFFVDGIHDDLLSTIAKIGSLKVISRTSVMEYKNTTKKIPEIARELGVANILEGGIQRSGNQVRINVQLIDAVTDEHLWAEIYDRELTAENLFAIQSEISQEIADALKTVLSLEEKTRINTMPTDNLQAYDSYLRGRQLMATRKVDKLQQAVEEFGKAVAIDPEFALAWVNLADANSLLAGYQAMSLAAAIPVMESAISRAMSINNELGEAYVSLAHIHEYYQREDEAEAAYLKAIELSPNYATAYLWYSNFVLRSSILRIAEATKLMERAFELDPRSSIISVALASRYRDQGLLSLAERQYLDLIALDPEFVNTYAALGGLYFHDLGRFDKALALYRKASELDPGNPFHLFSQLYVYQQLGDITAMEGIRNTIAAATGEDFWMVGWADGFIGVAQNNEAGTRETLKWLLPKIETFQDLKELVGYAALIFGDEERARELFLAANPGWLDRTQWERLIQASPLYPCMFSWILMNTGDNELGADLLRQTTIFLDETLPAARQHADAWSPEICYLTSGDTEKALDSIEMQLDHGHLYQRDLLFRMPMYDQIRDEPRFQAVVEERERRIAIQREAVAKMDAVSPP